MIRYVHSPWWRRMYLIANDLKVAIANREPISHALVFMDFLAHLALGILHLTDHAYPGDPPTQFVLFFNFVAVHTPWWLFHFIVVGLYFISTAVGSEKLISCIITLSWVVWTVWTVLMAFWVVTAPVSWVPPVMGAVMCFITWLMRRVWVEKET